MTVRHYYKDLHHQINDADSVRRLPLEDRMDLAVWDHAKQQLLDWLAEDTDLRVRKEALSNQNASTDTLGRYVHSSDPHLRAAVAANSSSTTTMRQTLAQDSDPRVRSIVAGARSAEKEIVRALADDPDDTVRSTVAGRQDLPFDLKVRLAQDESHNVRTMVWASTQPGGGQKQLLAALPSDAARDTIRADAHYMAIQLIPRRR